jgi:glucokinase
MKKLTIGLDIGGTKIRGILFDGKRIIERKEIKYKKKPPNKKEFLRALFGVADALFEKGKRSTLLGIGIGSAGVITPKRIYAGPTLSILNRINLTKTLSKRYHLPIKIENDVKTSALAEWHSGAARQAHSVFMITIGTGLGGAYLLNGKIQRGAFDSAYEAGFLIIDATRALEGKRGDFEWFGAENFFKSRNLDPIEAEIKARSGNKAMRKLWKEFGQYLGIGIASIINILEPEVFVIGGGISNAWPLFAPTMKKTVKRFVVSKLAREKTKIVHAKLGRDAGAIGAALLFFKI